MLLTITTTDAPATDLTYLLHKRPDRLQTFELAFGRAHVFYPEVTQARCTAALLVEVDPVRLVRQHTLDQYVSDRPYAASSFLSVAIGRVLKSALNGQTRERSERAAAPLALTARLPALPCRGEPDVLARLFEPLGYRVTATQAPLDARFPEWGPSPYRDVVLESRVRLADLLAHLYVLVPVLDDDKHYWVGEDEVAKLLDHGGAWLATHPERDLIAKRYLKHRRDLAQSALGQLAGEVPAAGAPSADPEVELERGLSLDEQRIAAVASELEAAGARSVLDLGCGEGRLLAALFARPAFARLLGMDASVRALERAARRLMLEELPARRERVTLIQGALTYRDRRLEGFDAAAVVEVIEHLDPARLAAFERVVFGCARPRVVVLTTPNRAYNALFPRLAAGAFRHADHRFEWTREEFAAWAHGVGARHGYAARLGGVGPEHETHGPPTQLAVMTRLDAPEGSAS